MKYMNPGYMVFQFEVKNLLANVAIKDVAIVLGTGDSVLELVSEVKAPCIKHKEIGYCYSILRYDADSRSFPVGSFQAKMMFTMVEFDPNTNAEEGSYPEEYVLPEVTLSAKDYTVGKSLSEGEFK